MFTTTKMIDGRKTLSTSEICEELGIGITRQALFDLGFTPAFETHVGSYWFADELAGMAGTLAEVLESMMGGFEEKHGVPFYVKEAIDL